MRMLLQRPAASCPRASPRSRCACSGGGPWRAQLPAHRQGANNGVHSVGLRSLVRRWRCAPDNNARAPTVRC
eukprot:2554179-Pyramimonas_sp.AAC.1